MAFENYLKNIYYNPSNPASFSGPDKLYQFVKKNGKYMISKYRIRKWLQREDAFSLQRESRKPIKRSRIVVAGIDDQWSADLMDMVNSPNPIKEFGLSWLSSMCFPNTCGCDL